MIKKLLTICLLGMTFACFTETEKFVEDFQDLGLPRYTEEGNNTTGAYIDGEVWKSEYFVTPNDEATDELRFYHRNDSIWMALSGENKVSSQAYLLMFLLGVSDKVKNDYVETLKEQNLPLTRNNSLILKAELNSDDFTDTVATALNGLLFIRSVNRSESSPTILSGTFGFEVELAVGISTFYKGRFDFELRQNSIFDLNDSTGFKINENGDPILSR